MIRKLYQDRALMSYSPSIKKVEGIALQGTKRLLYLFQETWCGGNEVLAKKIYRNLLIKKRVSDVLKYLSIAYPVLLIIKKSFETINEITILKSISKLSLAIEGTPLQAYKNFLLISKEINYNFKFLILSFLSYQIFKMFGRRYLNYELSEYEERLIKFGNYHRDNFIRRNKKSINAPAYTLTEIEDVIKSYKFDELEKDIFMTLYQEPLRCTVEELYTITKKLARKD